MPDLQGSYAELQPIGAVGRRAQMEEWNTITRIADGAIGFGQPVNRSGDKTSALMSEGTLTAAAPTAQTGNTGNGTFGAITVSPGTTRGGYRLVMTAATTFNVFGPDGFFIGVGSTGVAFSKGGLAFTLTAGGTPFVANDAFSILVASTSGLFLGITEADIGLTRSVNVDEYAQYDNMPVCTMGVIWVLAGATVTAGQRVYWNATTKRYTNTATDLALSQCEFGSNAVDGGLVKVRFVRIPLSTAR